MTGRWTHGDCQEWDQAGGGQWDWSSVPAQVTIVLSVSSHSGISLSVFYQVGLVACATLLSCYRWSLHRLGNCMEQIPHKSLIGNCNNFLCLARTSTAYTLTSSPATRTVWTPSSPSLDLSLTFRRILTGRSRIMLLFTLRWVSERTSRGRFVYS